MKMAFTLSEVLIALTIIGVVSALTIPSILQTTERQDTISKLKKTYSVLNNWQTRAQVDYGHHSMWDSPDEIGLENYYIKYIKPYFNIMKRCNTGSECGYKSNNPFTMLNGGAGVFVNQDSRVAFSTLDGMNFSFVVFSNTTGSLYPVVKVDINGAKGPNRYGRDVFMFYRTEDKGVKPYYYNNSINSINTNCSKSGTGDACAARIMRNSWKFDSSYPW